MKTFGTLWLCLLTVISVAQPGTFDPDFDGDGRVLTNLSIAEDVANKIVQLPGGKILVGGDQNVTGDNDFALTRYNPDGSIDPTFGSAGTSTSSMGGNDRMNSFAVQADGKIVCVGHTAVSIMTTYNIAIMRFNANGGLDTGFGTGGQIEIDLNGSVDEAYDVAIQPDGKIVVVGYGDMGSGNNSYESVIFRFNADGTPDNTFSFDGKVITTVSSDLDLFRTVLLQPDGKIVGVGFAITTNLNGSLVRYNADGTLDNTFGTGGKVITDYTNGETERLYGACLQPDGKIVVCGHAYIGADDDFLVARYNSNGTLDATFANSGFRTIDISLTNDYLNATTLQSDGKILLVGAHDSGTEYAAICFRLNADGTSDNNFNSGIAYVQTNIINSNSDSYSSVAMQSDGKIIICGTSIPTASYDYTKFIVRILSGLTIGVVEFTQAETAPLIYPNPIQQTETLKYTLAENETISILLFDAFGKLVCEFEKNQPQAKGDHEQVLTIPESLPAGGYILKISSNRGEKNIKLVK